MFLKTRSLFLPALWIIQNVEHTLALTRRLRHKPEPSYRLETDPSS